jgi:cell division protein ZapA (FtsZ GTPase activity inhibitor)
VLAHELQHTMQSNKKINQDFERDTGKKKKRIQQAI